MKITLISLDVLGINDEIAKSLKKQGYEVNHINFHTFRYQYPTVFHRIFNFIGKTFFKYDIKKNHLNKEILKRLNEIGKQDKILMLNANFLLPQIIKNISSFTEDLTAFFNDNIERIPKILLVAPFFNEVYTFEPNDSKNHNFKFATNYIFKENKNNLSIEQEVFNISTFSKRSKVIDNIALQLDELGVSYKIVSFGKKKIESKSSVEYVTERINMKEVNELVAHSNVLLDIHREGQDGLSFRVFESLGNNKKLITTNAAIASYDFYNPNNILIIDKNDIQIPKSFFENEYEEIPDEIYQKYLIDNWIKRILNL